jgi:hypothetical protein
MIVNIYLYTNAYGNFVGSETLFKFVHIATLETTLLEVRGNEVGLMK